jgi:hypothetical protein
MMGKGFLRRTAAALAASLLLLAPPAGAAGPPEPPSCSGRDLLAEMRASAPEAYARVAAGASRTANGEAMLWRISRPGVRPSHLLGTIHVSDRRIVELPPGVRRVLAEAEHLAVEVADLSPQAFGAAIARLRDKVVFADGRSLAKLLTPEEHAAAQLAATNSGLPEALFAVARPWLVTMMLALSDCERTRLRSGKQPLDLALAAAARERAIPVTGLETLEDQLGAMAAVPEADQLTVLRASLKLNTRSDDALETILRRYLAREIAWVWPLQMELWRQAGFDPDAFASFQRELVTVRNARMRDAARPLLEKGNALIAVGALHIVGQDGLVALLRAAGFDVVPVE